MSYAYDRPLPPGRRPEEILYPRTFDGCVAAGIAFCVSSTDIALPRLTSVTADSDGLAHGWMAAPKPDFSRTALVGVWPHRSALWWFSIDGGEGMLKTLQGEPVPDENRYVHNSTRPSLARLVAETFEHRLRLVGLTRAFEPWLALADKLASPRQDVGFFGREPEHVIQHALLLRGGDPDIAGYIARSIAFGKKAEDVAYAPYVREAALAYRDTLPDAGLDVQPTPEPALHRIPLTRENLWFLYRFLDLIKAEIERVTGWTRGQIDYGIRKWDLSNWSPVAIDTSWAIRERVAKAHGIPVTVENTPRIAELADDEIARLRTLVLEGTFSWEGSNHDPAELLAGMERPPEAA